jgi:hypothetical protein
MAEKNDIGQHCKTQKHKQSLQNVVQNYSIKDFPSKQRLRSDGKKFLITLDQISVRFLILENLPNTGFHCPEHLRPCLTAEWLFSMTNVIWSDEKGQLTLPSLQAIINIKFIAF